LKCLQFLGYLKHSPYFMQPVRALPYSRQCTACHCYESDQSSPHPLNPFLKIHSNSVFLYTTSLSHELLVSGFLTKTLHSPLPSPISATCTAHLIFLDSITPLIFCAEFRSYSCTLRNHFQFHLI